jgi:HEPN domain-containing protein
LKALYFVVLRREPPRTHSVSELYTPLREAGWRLPGEADRSIYVLNKYYTVTIHPDAANGLPSESVDEEEARRALRLARMVCDAARRTVEGS